MPITYSDIIPTDAREREWWYNSLDAAVTLEIHHKLAQKNASVGVYDFERSLQGPALEMMLSGFMIDPVWRSRSTDDLVRKEEFIQDRLDRLAHAVWGKSLNPRSPDQLKEFLYNELNLPEQIISVKGEKKVSTGREALEKLRDYYIAQPFVNLIFEARDARKTLTVLRQGVDPDGFMRCSYNVCGTETGRWSSSKNVYGRAGNLQNITEKLRRMFIARPGFKLVYVDGEQAESRSVGFIHGRLFNDWTYLDACEDGDLHTTVTSLVWRELGWSGNAKIDREIADQIFYRHFSYRDMSKRGGHGTNYVGSPWTMAKHLKVPVKLIQAFQASYFEAFPSMKRWHRWVANELGRTQSITTFLGRERTFFGRPNDDATHRKAVAFEPQSTVGDLVNEGGYRVWKNVPGVRALAQIHDAWIFEIPQDREAELVPQIVREFSVPVTTRGRTMIIPSEAMTGWNWSKEDPKRKTFSDGNPDGLRKWQGSDTRKRREDPSNGLLDRVLY